MPPSGGMAPVSERVIEACDRMTTIIRQIDVGDGSSKSIICGTVAA